MRDATHVVLALLMCSLIAVMFDLIRRQEHGKRLSILDLNEFYSLPYEIRSILRKQIPDPSVVRQEWSKMTADQKRGIIKQMTHLIPQPPPPPPPPSKGLKKGFLLDKNKKKDTKDKEKNEVSTLSLVGNSNVMPANDSFLGTED
jgi:hypothetical protein